MKPKKRNSKNFRRSTSDVKKEKIVSELDLSFLKEPEPPRITEIPLQDWVSELSHEEQYWPVKQHVREKDVIDRYLVVGPEGIKILDAETKDTVSIFSIEHIRKPKFSKALVLFSFNYSNGREPRIRIYFNTLVPRSGKSLLKFLKKMIETYGHLSPSRENPESDVLRRRSKSANTTTRIHITSSPPRFEKKYPFETDFQPPSGMSSIPSKSPKKELRLNISDSGRSQSNPKRKSSILSSSSTLPREKPRRVKSHVFAKRKSVKKKNVGLDSPGKINEGPEKNKVVDFQVIDLEDF
eukprot:TRINITY_DN9683_c0_g1_i1.p1 TRINITY_DN9683_c0_g1~~TRINITY_DN9683_c0_g1_i1.p1  ORF type:complete len:296 (-),score=52.92 TRINITY_DN9683_c0_g1_i1:69-956(-)